MGKENLKEEMQAVFLSGGAKYQTSLLVNMKLLSMSDPEMIDTFQKFGLSPIGEYLDIRTLNVGDNNWAIRGFIRYIDRYLIERSGGKRSELVKLGKEINGKEPSAFSIRLMRLEIISTFLSKFRD